jgi:hypothetical protein
MPFLKIILLRGSRTCRDINKTCVQGIYSRKECIESMQARQAVCMLAL